VKKCPFCAEEIQDDAVYCKHCRQPLSGGSASLSQQQLSALRSNLPMLLGVGSAIFLFVGVFLPIVRLPIVGSINYFQNGRGDGVLVLVMMAVAVLLLLRRRFVWLMLPGACVLTGLALALISLQSRMAELRSSPARDLDDNPFRGLAEAFELTSVQTSRPISRGSAYESTLRTTTMNVVLPGALVLLMMVCGASLGPLCISSTAMAQDWPFQRLTEAITRDMVKSAIIDSRNEGIRVPLNRDKDKDRILFNFKHRVRVLYEQEFSESYIVRDSPELLIAVVGPAGKFLLECSEAIRKMEPSCDKIKWTPEASVIVTPKTLNSPDIIRVALQSHGKTILPTFNGLALHEMSTATGEKRLIHRGEIRYPIAAFESGGEAILTLIPEAGKNIVNRFAGRSIQ